MKFFDLPFLPHKVKGGGRGEKGSCFWFFRNLPRTRGVANFSSSSDHSRGCPPKTKRPIPSTYFTYKQDIPLDSLNLHMPDINPILKYHRQLPNDKKRSQNIIMPACQHTGMIFDPIPT